MVEHPDSHLIDPRRMSWADITEEEQATFAETPLEEVAKLTEVAKPKVESLPRLPRKAPGVVFRAAINLYRDVVLHRVNYYDAVRWSHRLEAPAGAWLRRILVVLKPPLQPSHATTSAQKVHIKLAC